jgi:hypothetical protein
MNSNQPNHFIFNILPSIISVIFHPIIMPLLGTYLLLFTDNPASFLTYESKNIVLYIVALCTFGLPLFLILLLNFKKINNVNFLSRRQDRIFPLIVASIIYYFNFHLLRKMGAPALIVIFHIATVFTLIVTLIINAFWKISTHMIGIGGITGIIFVLILFYRIDALFYLLLAIFFSGIIGFARLSLNAHTPAQIYTGFFGGFTIIFLSFIVLV